MSVMTAPRNIAFDADTRVSIPAAPSFPAAHATAAGSRLAGAVRWLIEMPRRRAVINELLSLSDHELADIGLDRGEVTQLFDRGFLARRRAA